MFRAIDTKGRHICLRSRGHRQRLLQRRHLLLHERAPRGVPGAHRTREEEVQPGHVLRPEIHQVIKCIVSSPPLHEMGCGIFQYRCSPL